jgi:sugar phosphate isomerase/epimerase
MFGKEMHKFSLFAGQFLHLRLEPNDERMKTSAPIRTAMIAGMAILFLASCGSGNKPATEEDQAAATEEVTPDFQISLAEWSYHRAMWRETPDWKPEAEGEGTVDPIMFPEMAAANGIDCIELVNTFYFKKVGDDAYWTEFKKKCDEAGVKVGLIMCDDLGDLGDADPDKRKETVENHYGWVDIAKFLGAHSIRVNARGKGTPEEVAANAADGLSMLGEYAAKQGINVIVENHGGISSDGTWLSGVMEAVGMDNVGTLPDFGNFCIEGQPHGDCQVEYDRYKGVAELMPYARGVSAKSYEFDENGNEATMDYLRLMKIVKESGFRGYVGIEYEGTQLSEEDGIKATKALLEKVFAEI